MAADKPHMGLAAEPAAGDVADLTDLLAPAPREHMFSGEAASEDSAALLSLPPTPRVPRDLGTPSPRRRLPQLSCESCGTPNL